MKSNGKHGNPIAEALAPLVAHFDQIESEISDLQSQLQSKRDEAKRLRKHLQMEGLVEPTVTVRKAKKQPAGKWFVSEEMLDRIREAIEKFDGEFTQSDIRNTLGIAGGTTRNGIEQLRENNEIRMVGKRRNALAYRSML